MERGDRSPVPGGCNRFLGGGGFATGVTFLIPIVPRRYGNMEELHLGDIGRPL